MTANSSLLQFRPNNDFGLWWRPFGVYIWSDTLRFRFSWGPYFAGGWRPSFRRIRRV